MSVPLILTGISSRIIYRLQRVQKLLARVVTRSTTITTSSLNSFNWLPIQQQINFKLATLFHRLLHNAGPLVLVIFTSLYSRQLRSAVPIWKDL